jgi:hypothetical protein
MKRKTLSVTVTKVVQAAQFEPLTVSITEVAELEEGDKVKKVRDRLYESVSDSLHAVMGEELKRWKRKSKS